MTSRRYIRSTDRPSSPGGGRRGRRCLTGQAGLQVVREDFGRDGRERVEGKDPTFDEFEQAVERIEEYLIHRFKDIREMGLDANFSMVLGSVDKGGKASLYLFDSRGLAEPVHDNPGFAVIGSGFLTGGNLLLKLLGYDPNRSGEMDLGMLTASIIDSVSEVDSTVGPFLRES